MVWQQIIAGPQIVGAVMVIAGIVQQKFPPTDIDGLYGYRTLTSKQNQQTFDEGNRYSAKLIIWLGLGVIMIGLIIAPFINHKTAFINVILTLAAAIGLPLILTNRTEKHLREMFDNKKE